MWRCVDLVWTDVSEENIDSIFKVENLRARNQRKQVAADCQRKWRRNGCRSSNAREFLIGTGNLNICAKYNDNGGVNLQWNLQHN
jgi:hypothetical protein